LHETLFDFIAGSRFGQGGTFEVRKSDADTGEAMTEPTSPQLSTRSALQVTVPSELEGTAVIQVAIRKLRGEII